MNVGPQMVQGMMLRHYPTVLAQGKALNNLRIEEAQEAGDMLLRSKPFNEGWSMRTLLGMAYFAGIVDGKRQERARRKGRRA